MNDDEKVEVIKEKRNKKSIWIGIGIYTLVIGLSIGIGFLLWWFLAI